MSIRKHGGLVFWNVGRLGGTVYLKGSSLLVRDHTPTVDRVMNGLLFASLGLTALGIGFMLTAVFAVI